MMPNRGEVHSNIADILSEVTRNEWFDRDQYCSRSKRGYTYVHHGLIADVTRTTRPLHLAGSQPYTIARSTMIASLDFLPSQHLKPQSIYTLAALYSALTTFVQTTEPSRVSDDDFPLPEILFGMTSFPIALLATRFGFEATEELHGDPVDPLQEFIVYADVGEVVQAFDRLSSEDTVRKKMIDRMQRYFVLDLP
jgi:hypothetical protein